MIDFNRNNQDRIEKIVKKRLLFHANHIWTFIPVSKCMASLK